MKKILCSFGFLLPALPHIVSAQTTGSFTHTVTFMGTERSIACYVPEDYDPAVSYRLVVGLHGLGDNAPNYRNALVGPLGFESAHPHTILVCPDGGDDASRDFYTPAGDEAIIQAAIDFAQDTYNIDENDIVLQGFSLGGARALRYGLEHTDQFKGLLLNTPAVQGVKEAVTPYADGGIYDYASAASIPIYITHGSEDVLYTGPIDSMYEQLVRNNAAVQLFRFPSGHTVPPFSSMVGAYRELFEEGALGAYNIEVSRVIVPPVICGTSYTADVLVQNKGSEPITAIRFVYSTGEGENEYVWSGILAPQEHAEISLPETTSAAGIHELTVSSDLLNGSFEDDIPEDNTASVTLRLVASPEAMPHMTDFNEETFEEDWAVIPSGDYILPWTWDEEIGAIYTLNTIFLFENSGRKEQIVSTLIDLSSEEHLFLSFDVAYAYTQYTAAVLGIDTVFADTLEVLISTDCGETFESIYKKGGTDLLTFAQPVINPLSMEAHFIMPASSDWRREVVDIKPWADAHDEAIIKFSLSSGLGGVTFLDNIQISSETTSIDTLDQAGFNIYPNPASDKVYVASEHGVTIREVHVTDITGRLVWKDQFDTTQIAIETGLWSAGTYFISIHTDKGQIVQKLIISGQ